MKYNLKRDLLRLNQLQAIAEEWMSTGVCHQQISSRHHFKLNLSKVQGLRPAFFISSLVYMVSRMLPWMIIEWKPQVGLRLNDELKRYYRQLLFKSFFKATSMFELLIVYLIKLTGCFLQLHLNNFLVDESFQSELCITLYYTFLGVAINQKTYKLLQAKLVIKRCVPSRSRQSYISHESAGQLPAKPKTSFLSNGSRSSMKINSGEKISFKQIRMSRMSRMSFGRPFKESAKRESQINQINELFKENLYVPPLPPLKKRRINAREFERLQTEALDENEKFTHRMSDEMEMQRQNKPNFIFSNQLSPCLKDYYSGSLLFELNSKKVKIVQSRQKFRKDRSLQVVAKEIQEQHGDGVKKSDKNSGISSQKANSNDWTKLVSDLKKKVFNLRYQTEVEDQDTYCKAKQVESSPSHSSTDIQTPDQQVQQEETAKMRLMTSVPMLLGKMSESSSSESEEEEPFQLGFKRQREKLSFVVQNSQTAKEGSERSDLAKIFSKGKVGRKGRFLASSIIREDQDMFFNMCKLRKGSILQQGNDQKMHVNRHDSWLINQFKE